MGEAIALAMLVVALVILAGGVTIVIHRQALKQQLENQQRREAGMLESDRLRKEFERTGDPALLDKMETAIEQEEHRKWDGS